MSRRLGVLAATLLLPASLVACGGDDGDEGATAQDPGTASCTYVVDGSVPSEEVELPPTTAAYSGEVEATISTSAGEIPVTLDADAAPCTVNSFVSLAERGYYDAGQCYRLTEGSLSVLQCGNPTSLLGYTFGDELTGDEEYGRGVLAMANRGPATNSSEFFLVYDESELQPDYTVFGTVSDEGLEVVDEVASGGNDGSRGPGDGAPNTQVAIEGVSID